MRDKPLPCCPFTAGQQARHGTPTSEHEAIAKALEARFGED
jgi:hypothetical protein